MIVIEPILIIWNQSKLYNNVKVLQPAGSVAFYFIYLICLSGFHQPRSNTKKHASYLNQKRFSQKEMLQFKLFFRCGQINLSGVWTRSHSSLKHKNFSAEETWMLLFKIARLTFRLALTFSLIIRIRWQLNRLRSEPKSHLTHFSSVLRFI